MNKRVGLLILAIGLIVLWSMVIPYVQQAERTEQAVHSVPNYSPLGYQGLFQLIQTVHPKPVEPWRHSIMLLPPDSPKTVWFVEPGQSLFSDEPYIARRMRKLVENGYHFVFLFNSNTLSQVPHASEQGGQLDYLNKWFQIQLVMGSHGLLQSDRIPSASLFPKRQINSLVYRSPVERYSGWFRGRPFQDPSLLYVNTIWTPDDVKRLLVMQKGAMGPLAMEIKHGKGSVILFPNAYLFQNAQLNLGDNAALAVALSEINPDLPILFEEYSSGFTDNKDFLSYLASGKGVAFLISCMLLLFVFCLWVANRPIRKQVLIAGERANYFTQETFLSAMGDHYLSTKRWDHLYRKLLDQFDEFVSTRHGYLSHQERLQMIAQSPFYEVSLEELEAVYQAAPISGEAMFLEKSRILLEVLRKVHRHEFRQSKLHRIDPPFSNRR